MAKVLFDPVVKSISNGLGNFVYATRGGKAYIRMRPHKAAWTTPEQTKHRMMFGVAAKVWKALPEAVRKSWSTLRSSTGRNEFNIFMSENLTLLKKGEPMILSHGSGLVAPAAEAVSNSKGEISLTYKSTTRPLFLTVCRQTTGDDSRIEFVADETDNSDTQITLSGLASGKETIVYCLFCDTPMAEAGMISASQSVRVTVK
jgi:hypothetical protein